MGRFIALVERGTKTTQRTGQLAPSTVFHADDDKRAQNDSAWNIPLPAAGQPPIQNETERHNSQTLAQLASSA
ncbi:hypothetical protein GCM10010221_71150 [Streptomyces parvus]|nr:hypothetical protein GCM10010221_71150 [Streptomyces parvus]